MPLEYLTEGNITIKPECKKLLKEIYDLIERHFSDNCSDIKPDYNVQFKISKVEDQIHYGNTSLQ